MNITQPENQQLSEKEQEQSMGHLRYRRPID